MEPTPSAGRLPTFLHIGPGKTGSTWLHEVLSLHPDVYLSPAKDLYFFSRYYNRGVDWYQSQFADAPPDVPVVGEVCPDYLAHEQAAQRIRKVLGPDVRLMVTLRDPVDRAFSAYLYAAKHGLAQPTFRATVANRPEIVEEGSYTSLLHRYVEAFGADALRIGVFEDFATDPQAFLDGTTDWLGVARLPLTDEQLEAQLPASKARFMPLARVAKLGAGWVRNHDGARVVGRIKRAPVVQRMLYSPLGDDKPVISDEDRDFLRATFEPEIRGVEDDFGIKLRERWGWPA
jgi:Sulfotransferase domain